MEIKCCGMNDPVCIRELADVGLDYMGFIFWQGTPRSAIKLDPAALSVLPASVKRVGVFVDEEFDRMMEISRQYGLDAIQLHGNESADMCCKVRNVGLEVIKAFPIADESDLLLTKPYEDCCDFFVFDTKTELPGGSGKQYDWSLLNAYTGKVPFFLSGGVSPADVDRLSVFTHPLCKAIDINSRFEIFPGKKDTAVVKRFLEEINKNK